jgi:EAL domain-containing protein (putative c-di-GMP-specific phosphodiesterase class I)
MKIKLSIPDTFSDQERYWISEFIQNENFRIFFQPIVNLSSHDIFAYEALSRGAIDSPYENITPFILAEKCRMEKEFDIISLRKAIATISNNTPQHILFFLNVMLSNLSLANNIQLAENLRGNIVLELDFNSQLFDVGKLLEDVSILKDKGLQFAIDDLGKEKIDMNLIYGVEPSFLKIDIAIVQNIHLKKENQIKMEEFVQISKQLNCFFIIRFLFWLLVHYRPCLFQFFICILLFLKEFPTIIVFFLLFLHLFIFIYKLNVVFI